MSMLSICTIKNNIIPNKSVIKGYTVNINSEIVDFLDEILKYGNYKLNLSIQNIK